MNPMKNKTINIFFVIKQKARFRLICTTLTHYITHNTQRQNGQITQMCIIYDYL